MAKQITVLVAFVEARSGRAYQPGDIVTDPQWHAEGDRRAEAYAARGKVRVDELPAAPPAQEVTNV